MAVKKPKKTQGKSSRKTKARPKSRTKFPCPNPGKKLSLEQIVRRMQRDSAFAKFIGDLLRDAHGDDDAKAKAAQACLSSYFDPSNEELSNLSISKRGIPPCTVPAQNMLLVVPAKIFGKRKRPSKR